MPHWKKLSTQTILEHPRMHIVEDEVILPNNTKTHYIREINRNDYVTIIAKQAKTIAMVHDYSYPNDQMLLQFPEGGIDNKETPEEAAIRELKEETGFHADQARVIGKMLNDHRRSTATGFVCFANDAEDTGVTSLEGEESYTKTVHLTEDEITQKIASGVIVQKNTLAAWAIYRSMK